MPLTTSISSTSSTAARVPGFFLRAGFLFEAVFWRCAAFRGRADFFLFLRTLFFLGMGEVYHHMSPLTILLLCWNWKGTSLPPNGVEVCE
jgi:hypothetical protein